LQFSVAHGATNARLNHRTGNGKTGAWSTLFLEQGQWIQVDLGDITKVTKIATQGRAELYEWVTEYKVSYSYDGGYFAFYKSGQYGSDRVSYTKTLKLKSFSNSIFRLFVCFRFILWRLNFHVN